MTERRRGLPQEAADVTLVSDHGKPSTTVELITNLEIELAQSQEAYTGLYARYNAVLTERDKLLRVLEEIRHKAETWTVGPDMLSEKLEWIKHKAGG